MRNTFKFIFILLPLMVGTGAFAQSGADDLIIVTGKFFYMSDESVQGGNTLPGGATTYMQFSGQYNIPKYLSGAGLVYHMTSAGKTQSETAISVKLELYTPDFPLYFEYVPYGMVNQTFTNRAIQTRDGYLSVMGLGLRTTLFDVPWLFFDGCFQFKTTTYTKEDGTKMPDPIKRTERMPFLGLGVKIGI